MTDAQRLLSQIDGRVPQRIPAWTIASGMTLTSRRIAPKYIDCSCDLGDAIRPGTPGTEARYIDREHEYAFVTLAVTDHDYEGQHMFIQIAERSVPATTAFSEWRWAFYHRRGDTGWDNWILDINHDTTPPTFAAFGAYVDGELA